MPDLRKPGKNRRTAPLVGSISPKAADRSWVTAARRTTRPSRQAGFATSALDGPGSAFRAPGAKSPFLLLVSPDIDLAARDSGIAGEVDRTVDAARQHYARADGGGG